MDIPFDIAELIACVIEINADLSHMLDLGIDDNDIEAIEGLNTRIDVLIDTLSDKYNKRPLYQAANTK